MIEKVSHKTLSSLSSHDLVCEIMSSIRHFKSSVCVFKFLCQQTQMKAEGFHLAENDLSKVFRYMASKDVVTFNIAVFYRPLREKLRKKRVQRSL